MEHKAVETTAEKAFPWSLHAVAPGAFINLSGIYPAGKRAGQKGNLPMEMTYIMDFNVDALVGSC